MLKKFFAVVFNILFPNHCIICKNIIQSDKINYICLDCINKLSYIHRDDYIRCNRCGRIIDTKDSTCICSYENIYFDECKSMLYYDDKTSNLIHKMKFSHRYLICKDFAVMLSFYYKDYINKFDAVSFVPLGKNRLLERGYNQSELIARHIYKNSKYTINRKYNN
ncbi:putative phosphoribosyltransferace [Brachyspira pilosicoli P43/6/78]|uniref:Putative phosphoribosyltransferace n=1 Tax=Brachyspira pilosicoli P43/6/78 TaxID=1042417 RepID=A0A3B6VMV6_BRAPL|nr:putative phosphoribosyltransferace [Brachyspira pilosicoli P43/6/78]